MKTKILDKSGRPYEIDPGAEIASPSLFGPRRVWNADSMADGLTPEVLAGILQAANSGSHHDYLTLAEEMEEREPHYGSVLGTRKRAVSGLEIQVEAAGEDAAAQRQADEIRALTEKPAFRGLVGDLLDALGKGYSVCEIIWDRGGAWTPVKYIWRDPRFFVFADDDDQTLRLADEADYVNGVELPPHKFIIHRPKLKAGIPARSGLARLAAASYMCKSFTLADWMSFCELFGLPIRVGRYGKNASPSDVDILAGALASLGSDAMAVIPDSMKIEFIDRAKSAGGDKLFQNLAEWLDRQTSKAVLGQTMTADAGSSRSQAEVHNEVRHDIKKADAGDVCDTLNRDLVKPYIDFNHGVQAACPKIKIIVPEPVNVKTLSEALDKLVPLGLKVSAREVRGKIGLKDPGEDDELLAPVSPAAPARNTRAALNARTPDDAPYAPAPDEDDPLEPGEWERLMAPVVDPVSALAHDCDDYDEFLRRLPDLLDDMDPEAVVERLAWETFMARAEGDANDEI